MLRCLIAIILCLLALTAEARFPRGGSAISQNNGGLILNLGGLQYYTGYNAFLNWFSIGDAPVIVSNTKGTLIGVDAWDDGTYFETSTGELKTPLPADTTSFARGFFTPVEYPQYQYAGTSFNNFSGEQFDITWTGCSNPSVSITGTLGTGGTITPGSNSATIVLGSSGYSNIALVFTFTGIPACYSDPPKNIKIYQHRYATNVANGEIFNPDWINAVKPFGYLRLMDWMVVNFGGISDISQLADFNYTSLQQNLSMTNGIASFSGTVMDVSGLNYGKYRVGQRIVCVSCPSNLTITSLGTGNGGTGTYNLNQNVGTISSRVVQGVPVVGQNWSWGPKGGIHPNVACSLANASRTNIEFTFPIAASDQMITDVANAFKACMPAGLRVRYSYGNENWNFGFDTYRYTIANSISNYSGYRSAEISALIANAYGKTSYPSDLTSTWEGSLGGQLANNGVLSGAISGANAYRTAASSPYSMAQLFRSADVAPYWGNFYGGVCISNVTAAATPLVTIDSGCGNDTLSNGQLVYIMVKGGTMSGVLNGVYATVSNYNGSTFNINVNTTGLTYGTGTAANGVLDATLFKLIDQSISLNGSTPATYPTRFSYFAQQMSKAILNGSASDASYGTITIPSGLNLTTGAGGILSYFQQNALLAQAQGLQLSQYEGGPTQTLNSAGSNIRPPLAVEFLNMSLYDAGVTGDTVNTPANVYNTSYSQFDSVNGLYQSQFNEGTPVSPFGPWGAIRFFPGDTSNLKWSNILTRNALGPYNPNIPVPTWSVNYNSSTDHNFTAGASSLTCPVTTSGGLIVVPITWADASASITSVSISGGVGAMTQDALTVNAWTAAIYSKVASAGTYTITINWNTSATFASCYALTLSGLASNVVRSTTTGNPQKTSNINVLSGSFIIAAAIVPGSTAPSFNTDSTQGPATGTVTQINNVSSQASAIAYWSPGPSFSSTLFSISTNAANGLVAATYK